MITEKEYDRNTSEDWEGRRVKSRVAIANGYGEMPAGTVFTITRKYDGFKLRSEACEECGFQMYVKYVPPHELDVVDDDGLWRENDGGEA